MWRREPGASCAATIGTTYTIYMRKISVCVYGFTVDIFAALMGPQLVLIRNCSEISSEMSGDSKVFKQ